MTPSTTYPPCPQCGDGIESADIDQGETVVWCRSGHQTRTAAAEHSSLDTAYRVCLPYATFTLVARGGRIHRAPPIARRALGMPEELALDYYRRAKGATIARIA